MIPFFVQPLSVFPDLLNYSFFAPLILRLGVGLIFVVLAYRVGFSMRMTTKNLLGRFPVFKPQAFWITLGTLLCLVVGLLLILGLYTQIAALLTIVTGFKLIALKKITETSFLNPSTCFLLIIMGLALLISGPGAFAIDLPL